MSGDSISFQAGTGSILRLPLALNQVNGEIFVQEAGTTLSIAGRITGPPVGTMFFTGMGTLVLANGQNMWRHVSMFDVTVRIGVAGAWPDESELVMYRAATLVLNDVDETIGSLTGATFLVDNQTFRITYRGGDGNDIALRAEDDPSSTTYFLSEGATGSFFDEDVALANPHDTAAPVTLTFSTENGDQVVATRTVPARSRLTVRVDDIAGLENIAASVQVRSDSSVPLAVERTMFWDAASYAGHTGGAVSRPSKDWFFAEGSQGFFQTFVLIINPATTPADVTFTFLRENEPAVVKTMRLGASSRLTLPTGDVPELGLKDESFGALISVTNDVPIIVERSMYWDVNGIAFSGGTNATGIALPSNVPSNVAIEK